LLVADDYGFTNGHIPAYSEHIAHRRSMIELNQGFQLTDAIYFCRKGMQVRVPWTRMYAGMFSERISNGEFKTVNTQRKQAKVRAD
jgi:hypothetical protein